MGPPRNANNQAIRDFLVSGRAKVSPEQAGLQHFGGNRRVPELRREEAAMLAGVSVDYYTRLEKGALAGASDSVLDAICRALMLDDAERTYLYDLARATSAESQGTRRGRPSARRADARVRPARTGEHAPPNMARFRFLDPAARDFYPDFDYSAESPVQLLWTEGARTPHDKDFTDLNGELCTRNENFRVGWASHDVRPHYHGTKLFHHAVVGELRLSFESFDLPGDPGLTLTALSAAADTASADALKLLASWATTELEPSTRTRETKERTPPSATRD